ncbi:phosphoribosylaminoimidazole carboxylase, catalytic subunit [Chloroherpeton thalassium ATCC 35110]|uniref:N5-carboxyaminoimidazole ribonucleotide mutase n=1 Tax=Chloroherpeton thalassium (strain ATCC 35110 / GB-78) TaxID=517418 RepID=B3QTA0_CHLT3|nr:5-(carboxyamino)imidazole ribonucleotide mutase [Chloroherpeton thalassium]ACF14199.1 phosphoribosylaminoimidazole carboxylase, catalytic subunit [Chloroherpeton thalassium ATCC 35110]
MSASSQPSQENFKIQSSDEPLVGIIMGSDSDLTTMIDAPKVLSEFGIPYEVRVVSAHRTPDDMATYAKAARQRGLQVIIAGAGGAAHLPGMTASYTTLPVIGVPVVSKALGGVDSLYSIVQMPAGIPVATVAIGNAKNAGLLAAQILSTSDAELAKKLDAYRANMAQMSRYKNKNL